MKNKVFRDRRKSSKRKPIEIEGVFKVHPKGFAFVAPSTPFGNGEILRVSRRNTGGAMPGDRVSCVVKMRGKRKGRMAFACEVEEVLKRASTVFVGTLRMADEAMYLFPDGKRQQSPLLVQYESDDGVKAGKKAVAKVVQYPQAGFPAVGRIIELLGDSGEPETEMNAVMRLKGLSDEFSEEAIEQAQKVAGEFVAATRKGTKFPHRSIVKDEIVITIDPDDARDFDDAVSVTRGPGDNVTLGVHIADVAHFVEENSVLDLEARARSTSVYFPGKVVPMLPDVLSGGVCSLKESEPRFAKSVYIVYSKEGRVLETRFQESVIRSAKRLTYEQAESIRRGESEKFDAEVVKTIGDLESLAKRIESRRKEQGMLHLDLPEVRLVLDSSNRVVDAAVKEALYSHKMIEMFMVEANEAVASLLYKLEVPFLSRVHGDPDPESQKSAQAALRVLGHHIEEEPSRKSLQQLIESVKGLPEEYAVNMTILRSLTQAEYSATPEGHYALASERYSHFTSPIRRYPDLVVHRLFGKHCRGELKASGENDMKEMTDFANHCSKMERNAKEAENELRQVFVLLFLKDLVGEEFDGVVTGATDHGLFIQLKRFLAEGMIRFADLEDDWWELLPRTGVVRGQRSGKTFRMGQAIRVKISSIDVAKRHLNLVGAG